MTAAHSLPEVDELQEEPLDAACLARMCPEERALGEAAPGGVAAGTLRMVWQAEQPS